MRFRLLSLLLAGVAMQTTAAWAAAPEVAIDSGIVSGTTTDIVDSFKGIPFAAPPIGDLRWRAPQPAQPWTGVRAATEYGHDCQQTPFGGDAAPLGTAPAEDCLVLNVWRPTGTKADAKLPVMVWIYGGGFINGGSSPAVYDGSAFARKGVIMVSFNYRLGRFGFFGFPALTEENKDGGLLGNYGYMDQLAALRWVQRNVAAFGGDPANVTVFGESAGGGSVNVLLSSPMAKGLFAKAIIQSGGGRDNLMGNRRISEDVPGLISAEKTGVAFAKAQGIEGTGAEALAKLRALPAETFSAGFTMMTRAQAGDTYSGPVVDGKIVVESPGDAYRAGRGAPVPVISGANSADLGFSFAKTVDEAFAAFGNDAAAARKAYDPDGRGDLKAINARIGADRLMIEPARFVAATLAGKGQPTYEFRFSYVADSKKAEWPGALHATEIPYAMDTAAIKYGAALTPNDARVAATMNAYWVNFAKTGSPNGPGLPDWPVYDPAKDVLMDFTATGQAEAKPDPWKDRLDATARTYGK